MSRPRALDLYCGGGGMAVGLHRAGFEVVGVDKKSQPNYPFKFWRCDALAFLQLDWPQDVASNFDFIHASPPCQDYTQLAAVNRKLGRKQLHARLITETRELLIATGLPYVIENVVGSTLIDPVRVCGSHFNRPIRRHRLFESNLPLVGTPCEHWRFTERKYWTGWRPKGEHRLSTVVQVYGNAADKHLWPEAMGIDWMTYDEIAEAVPPDYGEFIGRQVMEALALKAAA